MVIATATRRGSRNLVVLLAALLGVVVAVVGFGPVARAQNAAESLQPGEIVVTQATQGKVLAINGSGSARELISGLETPRGVVVLSDQTVLVAENKADRIVAFGPVYGTSKIKVADFAEPEALAVAEDGQTIYVVSYMQGTLGRFDLESTDRTPEIITADLDQPTGVYVRGDEIYVTEVGSSSVVRVDPSSGERTTFASGISGPFGITGVPDGPIYVSEYQSDRVVAIDTAGAVSEFTTAPKPAGLAVDPVAPAREPYLLAVATLSSVQVLDQQAVAALAPVTFPESSVVGVAVVPGGSLPIGGVPPSSSPAGGSTTTERTAGSTVPTGAESSGDGTSVAGPLLIGFVFIVLVGFAITVAVQVGRRNRTSAEAGFADLASDYTMTEAVGPCAAMEIELAGAESALVQVREQIASARRRQEESSRRVERAKVSVTAAERAMERGDTKPAVPSAPTGQFTLEQLNLQTEEGRAALRAFGRKEITAAELRMRWEALGEEDAVRAVLGEAAAAAQTSSDDPAGGLDRARAELAEAEAEKLQATTDLGRFAERERQLEQRVTDARKALDDCNSEQRRAEDDAAAEAAAAFAAAQLSDDDKWAEFVLEGDQLPPEAAGSTPPTAKDAKPDAAKDAKPGAAKDAKPGAAKDAKPDAAKDAKPGAAKDAKPDAAKGAKPDAAKGAKPDAAKTTPPPMPLSKVQPGAKPAGASPEAAKPATPKPGDAPKPKPGDGPKPGDAPKPKPGDGPKPGSGPKPG
ncbi:MAG: hypothetical protein KDB36_11225 [Acidimicrobiales bacterium]|nr:hypothetical protein [Acidimicrobiales bacterium]